jgi:Putative peptidoglycan binding domain
MKALFTKISDQERMNILEMHNSKKVMSEQPLPAVNNSRIPDAFKNSQKPNALFCVKPEEYHIKGDRANSFVYQDKLGDNVFYNDGAVSLYDFGSVSASDPSNRLNLKKKGTWSCGSNGNIEVKWENDPSAVAYYPLPSARQNKNLNTSKCAQSLVDIHQGKFLFKGCKSPAVTELQQKLGFTKTTDFFGNATESAVKKYQQSKKIKDDGIVGQDTLNFLQP